MSISSSNLSRILDKAHGIYEIAHAGLYNDSALSELLKTQDKLVRFHLQIQEIIDNPNHQEAKNLRDRSIEVITEVRESESIITTLMTNRVENNDSLSNNNITSGVKRKFEGDDDERPLKYRKNNNEETLGEVRLNKALENAVELSERLNNEVSHNPELEAKARQYYNQLAENVLTVDDIIVDITASTAARTISEDDSKAILLLFIRELYTHRRVEDIQKIRNGMHDIQNENGLDKLINNLRELEAL